MRQYLTPTVVCALGLAVGVPAKPTIAQETRQANKAPVQPASRKLASEVLGMVKEVLVKEGQRVKKGEVLLRLDEREAQLKLKIAKLQVTRAEAEMKAAAAAAGETKAQYERLLVAKRTQPASVSAEELSMKEFVWQKHRYDAQTRAADLAISKLQLDLARLTLEKHEIRAPADGFIQTIHRRPGEVVKELTTVLELRADDGSK